MPEAANQEPEAPQVAFTAVCSSRDRTHWLESRKSGIGASEVAALIGVSRWASPLSLYAEKAGIADAPDLDSEAVEWGTRLEPAIIAAFGERTGRDVEPCGFLLRSTEHPFALATLDAWCVDDAGNRWPLEIKTTGAHFAEDWAEGPPPAYAAQVQWQMYVTGCDRATVACLIGGQKMVWADVARDDALIVKLVDAAAAFWECVQTETPPPADGTEASKAALARIYPADTGEIVELPATLAEVADRREAAKLAAKQAEGEVLEAENEIKAAMRDATRGTLPDGRAFSWKVQKREAYSVKAGESRVFRSHQPKESAK